MSSRIISYIAALIVLVLGSVNIYGQATLEITLSDSASTAIKQQPITVINSEIGFTYSGESDDNGKLQLDGLSTAGAYDIIIEESSFYESQVYSGATLISGQVSTINLTIRPRSLGLETVYITGGPLSRTANTVDAEVASELSIKEIENLPVEGRDITRALYRLPNITQATGFYPEAPTVAINGANSLYTNYQIDGLDNNENFLGGQRFAMPQGFTKNITALTNNFSAEHGLSSNGVINITSRSGTNETTGELAYVTRPGPVIDAPSRFAQRDLSGNQVRDGFQRHQFAAGIGGALKKDKTFYYVNLEHTQDRKDNLLNVPQLGINETVRGANSFTYLSAKLDHNWSAKWRSSLRLNAGNVRIERQGGGLEGGTTLPSAANTQTRGSLNAAMKNVYVGERFAYEANFLYGVFEWDYADPDNPTSPDVTVIDPQGITLASLGHPGFRFRDEERTQVIQQKLTLYRGEHRIRLGGQYKRSAFSLFGGGNPNGSYTVQLSEAQLAALQSSGIGSDLEARDIPSDVEVLLYRRELRPRSFQQTQQIYSLYVEDQWTLSRRTNVNIGLRYDYDNLSRAGSDQGDFNNLAPRLSLNYKLSSRASLRAGYGIYYDKIIYAVISDARQFNSTSEDYKRQIAQLVSLDILPEDTDVDRITNEGNVGASDPDVSYLQGPTADELAGQRESIFQNELRILNPNGLDNPYSHQIMMGYQYQADARTLFYADVMHNRSYNLFRIRNLNAPAPYSIDPEDVVVRTAQEADLTRPIPILTDDRGAYALASGDTLRGIARNIIVSETEGQSRYYAINLTLRRDRGDSDFSYRLMYTLSSLENDTEDINFRAMDSNDFEAEWGPSINDRRHLINGIFTYYVGDRLSVTLAALLQSGQPINRIPDATIYGTTDLNGDGRAFGDAYVGNSDRQPGESRNSDRLPWSNTFDLSAYYTIPVGNHHVEIGAQIFNLFNAENLSGYPNNATQSNQIQVGSVESGVLVRRNAAPPRQFQFSARYIF